MTLHMSLSAKLLEDYHQWKRGKKIVQHIAINLLVSGILLFGYPGKFLECLSLPWLVYVMSYIGYIPFAGPVVFYWAYKIVAMEMLWTTSIGLQPSLYTSVLFWLWIVIVILRTLESTARMGIADIGDLEVK